MKFGISFAFSSSPCQELERPTMFITIFMFSEQLLLPRSNRRGISIFDIEFVGLTSFDIKFVGLSKYDTHRANSFQMKDFSSFT